MQNNNKKDEKLDEAIKGGTTIGFGLAAVYSVATGALPAYWAACSAAVFFGMLPLAAVLPVAVPAVIGGVVGGAVLWGQALNFELLAMKN
jgi:hypothetical protein